MSQTTPHNTKRPGGGGNTKRMEYLVFIVSFAAIMFILRKGLPQYYIGGVIGVAFILFAVFIPGFPMREWVESLIVALIMALTIRCFAFEIFKIPTGSMEPTLLGDQIFGDKIIVNKSIYDFRSPDRWDVVVFKFPKEPSKNYIKRLIGLPGDKVEIRNGDIYINDQLMQKPERVQDALWMPVYQLNHGHITTVRPEEEKIPRYIKDLRTEIERHWSLWGPWQIQSNALATSAEKSSHYTAEYQSNIYNLYYSKEKHFKSNNRCYYYRIDHKGKPQIGENHISRQSQLKAVGDIRFALTMDLDKANDDGEIFMNIFRGRHSMKLRLHPATPGWAQLSQDGIRLVSRAAVAMPPHRDNTIRFQTLDGMVAFYVNDQLISQAPIYEPERPYAYDRCFVRFSIKGVTASISTIDIRRDICYLTDSIDGMVWPGGQPFIIGEDEYFVLGDNSPNSYDSRGWGTVPKANMVGEAFAIFWPSSRWRLIR